MTNPSRQSKQQPLFLLLHKSLIRGLWGAQFVLLEAIFFLLHILYDFVQCAVQPVPNAIKGYYIMPPQKSHAPILGTPI